MFRSALVAALAAATMISLSTLFPDDAIQAAEGDEPAPLSATDIIVDQRVLAPIEGESAERTDTLVAENAQTPPEVPAPTPIPATVATDAQADSLAELVRMTVADSGSLDAEAKCLAGAVYHEAKGETLAGQLAVAKVVIARSQSRRFPGSLCGVVKQRGQFSFVRGGSIPTPPDNRNWRNAVAISRIALADSWESPVEGALFFHAKRVSPGWRLTRMGAVDNHIFYR